MMAISKIADKHKLQVIEDNAQGIGARGPKLQDRRAQRRGQHQLHHPEEPRHLRRQRRAGHQQRRHRRRSPQAAQPRLGQRAMSTAIGFNSRLDDLHAGILSAKLKHIDEWNDLRRKWAARYTKGLQGLQDLHAARRAAGLPPRLPPLRHRDQEARAARPVGGVPGQERHRRQEPLLRSPSTSRTATRGARRRASSAPSPTPSRTPPPASRLPMFPELTAEEVDYVIAKVKEWDTVAAGLAGEGECDARNE